MSEEVKVTEEKECKCFCKSEGFRKFLTIALGTFVGVYAALCLFAAAHRPPMMVPNHYSGFGMRTPIAAPCPCYHHKHFNKHFKGDIGDFHKDFKTQKGPAPFEANRENNKD